VDDLPASVRAELEAHCWADVGLYALAEKLWDESQEDKE